MRKMDWGHYIKLYIFSVGAFLIDKTFLIPNSDVLNFSLLKSQIHELGLGDRIRSHIFIAFIQNGLSQVIREWR